MKRLGVGLGLLLLAVVSSAWLTLRSPEPREEVAVAPTSTTVRQSGSFVRAIAAAPISMPPLKIEAPQPVVESATGPAATSDPVARAQSYLEEHREEWKLRAYHEFRPEAYRNPMGTEVHFAVYEDGLPVVGLGIDLDVDPNGVVRERSRDYRPLPPGDRRGSLSAEEALRQLPNFAAKPGRAVSQVWFTHQNDRPELAYAFQVTESGPIRRPAQILVRASDGLLLARTYSRSER